MLNTNPIQDSHDDTLRIYTLGRFCVRRGDRIISSEARRSYKLWELFKFIISNRDRSVHGDTIIESLWPEQDYNDNRNSLHSMIYRLRQLIDNNCHNTHSVSSITFSAGTYAWNENSNCWLDAVRFEQLCVAARQASSNDPSQSINLYLEAIDVYKGDYLPELAYTEWTIPLRNYYHRLYVNAVQEVISLLVKSDNHEKVIGICEKAIQVEFYKEEIHAAYLCALIKDGNIAQARSHYEYASSVFHKEMGIDLKNVLPYFSSLHELEHKPASSDLTVIQKHLDKAVQPPGCMLCNPDVFRFLYKTELRRSERSGQPVFLAMFVLDLDSIGKDADPRECMDLLHRTLTINLRRGDVVCPWNDSQYLLLLTGLDADQAVKAINRIQHSFESNCKHQVKLTNDVKPIILTHL
ncbi:transcriptional regulator [hydrocarbon metagenome]|uniref:Transcriptional regulator n=1 Tax=hydrocarbon metagenome TaxID=938273 RepID=A0A0W8E1B5_9ZZZZ